MTIAPIALAGNSPKGKREDHMSAQSFAIKSKRTSKPARRTPGLSTTPNHLAQPVVIKPTQNLPIQAKLMIGQPNDKYEQEADRVADQVMRMSDADVAQRDESGAVQPMQIQRMCSECEEEQSLQRQPEKEEEEELQAKEIPGQTPKIAPNLESRINSLKGGGQPLDPATRSFFEPRFGHDFSNVRVHTDSNAADTSKSINARAFTLENHVVMGAGEYQPGSQSSQRLLGHELTHIIQQKGHIDLAQRAVSRHSNCRPNAFGAPANPLVQIQNANNRAFLMALGTSHLLFLDSILLRVPAGVVADPSSAFNAYHRRLGDPPRQHHKFRNRFTGHKFSTKLKLRLLR